MNRKILSVMVVIIIALFILYLLFSGLVTYEFFIPEVI